MNFTEWLTMGMENNWCGPLLCYTHDGLPTTETEDEEMYEGDPCIWMIRYYESSEHAKLVEENHSPSEWRKL